ADPALVAAQQRDEETVDHGGVGMGERGGVPRLPLQSGQGITPCFPVQATGVWRRPRARPQGVPGGRTRQSSPRRGTYRWLPRSRCLAGGRPPARRPAPTSPRRIAERGSEEDREEGREGGQAHHREGGEGRREEAGRDPGRGQARRAEEGGQAGGEEGPGQGGGEEGAGQGRGEEGGPGEEGGREVHRAGQGRREEGPGEGAGEEGRRQGGAEGPRE